MRKLLLLLTLAITSVAGFAQDRPKLVVGVVVDQMRWDYLYRYHDLYGDGGFKRLMREGFNCENTMINYIPTITAVGHASLFTGSIPSIHGIAGNNFYVDGQYTYCTSDSRYNTVGSDTEAGRMSPKNLLTTTIGDEIRVATNFQGKVIGVSVKDRASILPAGHSANGAFWMDKKARRFVTSTYYMKALPAWAEQYNKHVETFTADQIYSSPIGNEVVEGMAEAAISGEQLGQDNVTDMITISFSIPDMVGHQYGTHDEHTQSCYVDMDKKLARLLTYLDTQVGKGQYLFFLVADHGAANGVKFLQEHKIASGGFFAEKVLDDLNAKLGARFETKARLAERIMDYKVCLDRKAIAAADLDYGDVKQEAIDILQASGDYSYVLDLEDVAAASVPAVLRERIINGYNSHRGGDIQIIVKPAFYEIYGDKIDGGTTHGTIYPYDAHIPFILTGWGIKAGSTTAPVTINDIAATVCSMIHVQLPNGCFGNPVQMK